MCQIILKKYDLQILPRQCLSLFPLYNSDKSCSYTYKYKFINNDFYILQCKDGDIYKNSSTPSIIYTLFKLTDCINIVKSLKFSQKIKPIPTVSGGDFYYDSVMNDVCILINFNDNQTYKFYVKTSCETDRLIFTDVKENELYTNTLFLPKSNSNVDVISKKKECREFTKLILNSHNIKNNDDYNFCGYKWINDVESNNIIGIPYYIPKYDMYISMSTTIILYIFVVKNDGSVDSYPFEVTTSINNVPIIYNKLSYANIINKKIQIGFVIMDNDNGTKSDTVYLS